MTPSYYITTVKPYLLLVVKIISLNTRLKKLSELNLLCSMVSGI